MNARHRTFASGELEKPAAPPDEGRVLARCARAGRPGQAAEELRLALRQFEGHPFIDLRVWYQTEAGQWLPTKKGCSIRRGELEQIGRGLREAYRELFGSGAQAAHQPRSKEPEPREAPKDELSNEDLDDYYRSF